MIKKRERDKYSMIDTEEKNKIKKRSLERYYKPKAQYKECASWFLVILK